MKQRFTFEADYKNGTLTVQESGEVDTGIFQPLHEESYNIADINEALSSGLEAFTQAVRRKNFFPVKDTCIRFFDNLPPFIQDESQTTLVLECDDADSFPRTDLPFIDEDDVELDTLLDEDGDTKEDEIKEIDDEDDTPRFMPEDNSEHEN